MSDQFHPDKQPKESVEPIDYPIIAEAGETGFDTMGYHEGDQVIFPDGRECIIGSFQRAQSHEESSIIQFDEVNITWTKHQDQTKVGITEKIDSALLPKKEI